MVVLSLKKIESTLAKQFFFTISTKRPFLVIFFTRNKVVGETNRNIRTYKCKKRRISCYSVCVSNAVTVV